MKKNFEKYFGINLKLDTLRIIDHKNDDIDLIIGKNIHHFGNFNQCKRLKFSHYTPYDPNMVYIFDVHDLLIDEIIGELMPLNHL